MDIIFPLIPLALVLWGFFWAVCRGQFANMAGIDALACRLMYPTRSGHDQQLMLRHGPDGRLHGGFVLLTERHWIVQAGTQDWRLMDNLNFALSAALEPSPQPAPPSS